jgi:hypothetical protein
MSVKLCFIYLKLKKTILWLLKCNLMLHIAKSPHSHVDIFCREFNSLSNDTHVSYTLIWRFFEKNAKNWFFDFSNAILRFTAQNRTIVNWTFFVENFILFRMIPISYIPISYSFWEKCKKPTFLVTVGVR